MSEEKLYIDMHLDDFIQCYTYCVKSENSINNPNIVLQNSSFINSQTPSFIKQSKSLNCKSSCRKKILSKFSKTYSNNDLWIKKFSSQR